MKNNKDLNGIYEWLMILLNYETCNNVQRFGAAEGISELLASYHSRDKLNAAMTVLLQGAERRNEVIFV